MQSTLRNKLKTHRRILPQSAALGVSGEQKGKAKPSTNEICAVFQHDRGERPALSAGPSPAERPETSAEKSGVTRIFVLAKDGAPLMPCHAARARELLAKGKAVVVRLYPFVIRLKYNPVEAGRQPVALKIDPGARTSGLAIARVSPEVQYVLHLSEVTHRGADIHERMDKRAKYRRNRRNRKTRYRPNRFRNRTRAAGWLQPSLNSRVDNIVAWVSRYRRWAPISQLVVETVRFDTQRLVNPEIDGIEYQQGTLYGYEVREYLLEKWGRRCAYCDRKGLRLEIEHIIPKGGRGRGTDRVSNLTLACHTCNETKSNQSVEVFLEGDPVRLKRILSQRQIPLAAAAAVNATRTKLLRELNKTNLPVEVSTGGKTKFNRTRLIIPKTHALDAACTGTTPALQGWKISVLAIKAFGRERTSARESIAPAPRQVF
jgi:5-methylcytosine-specific restriction endonuclease McrA